MRLHLLAAVACFALAAGAASGAEGKTAVCIVLPSDVHSGMAWNYVASHSGIVVEGAMEDLPLDTTDVPPGVVVIPDEVPPGSMAFVFKGLNPGDVVLTFRRAPADGKDGAPDAEEMFRLRVFPDLTLAIVEASTDVY